MMKHIDLDSPVRGKEYWVVRYPEDLDPDYSIDLNDLCVAEYLGKGIWLNYNNTKFKSPHYMEVPFV